MGESIQNRSFRKSLAFGCLILAGLVLFSGGASAEEEQERRTATGIKLFRYILAADLDLESRVEGGKLLVLVFHPGDQDEAVSVARALAGDPEKPEKVRKIPLVAEVTSDPTFARYEGRRPAAIFVAGSPRREDLPSIVQYGISHGLIVYSPFEGHVEQGVLGGLAVGAKVQPYVNYATLQASGVELREFFFKAAKVLR